MYGAKGLCADGIEEITLNAHLEPVEIFAIVAIGAAILGFVYWRIRRSRKGKRED
jgi:hypothetical protein